MALGAAAILAACGDETDDAATSVPVTASATDSDAVGNRASSPAEDHEGARPVAVERIEPSPPEVTVSGLGLARGGTPTGAPMPEPLVDLLEIISGGPPPDGIPSIDEPEFLRAGDVDFLADDEPVLALDIAGDRRAYPVQIMIWHEIVNDTVGGVPVAVTYCPLCNSALVYDRRVDGRILEFGTSGLLWNSSLVMYDRQTETLWSHFTGSGIVGELTGVELNDYPAATVPWDVWLDATPDGLVLSRNTGSDRDYGRNPYPGYDDVDGEPLLFQGAVDGRFTAMTRIVGVEIDGDAVGVALDTLRHERVVSTEIAGTSLVLFWQPGTASALDSGDVSGGDDIGATGVFVPRAGGQDLTFTARGEVFVDGQTGSTWNLLGEALDGPLAGTRLEAIAHVDTFWFAWSAFLPDSSIVE